MKITLSFAVLALVASCYCQELASENTVSEEVVDYSEQYDVEEGDILVPKTHGKVALRNNYQRFPNGVVPYAFQQGYPVRWQQNIRRAMDLIESKTCVTFVPRQNQRDYVQFINDRGCYSVVGRIGGRQPISLSAECQQIFVAAHEMMHALGIFHEHTRPDRDEFIHIEWGNIPRAAASNYQKRGQWEVVMPRTIDFESIMMYDPWVFSRNGRPTMVSKVAGKKMLRPHEKPNISEGDVKLINYLYQCPQKSDAGNKVAPVPTPATRRPVVRPQPATQRPPVRPPVIEDDDGFWPFFGRRNQVKTVTQCPDGYAQFGKFCIPKLGRFV